MRARLREHLPLAALVTVLVAALPGGLVIAQEGEDPLDPVRSAPLGCGIGDRPLPGTPGRAQDDQDTIRHLAYICGVVGTDVEFQSRRDARGEVHDFAFAATVGDGLRVYDVTDPQRPKVVGRTNATGYQNDVQLSGDVAFLAYEGLAGPSVNDNTSTCLREAGARGQGLDVFRLNYDAGTATFDPALETCVPNPPGGDHTHSVNPTGEWISIQNPGDRAIDVIDIRGIETPGTFSFSKRPEHRYRIADPATVADPSKCPTAAAFACIEVHDAQGGALDRPTGGGAGAPYAGNDCPQTMQRTLPCFRPHDAHFSADGDTLFCSCLESTMVLDVRRVLEDGLQDEAAPVPTRTIIPNDNVDDGAPESHRVFLSHQADITPDQRMLVIADERGGGVTNTDCNTGDGVIGALHFYALAPIEGQPETRDATVENPVRLGTYLNPDPNVDLTQDAFRLERGCTVHVFRIGGNGGSSPGEGANPGLGGVSSLPSRQLTTAWYGAGVWYLDFSAAPDSAQGDRITEDEETTWGNTLGYNIQIGADTWSAKEYKGNVFAGDLARGFDTYALEERTYGDGPHGGPPAGRPGGGRPPEGRPGSGAPAEQRPGRGPLRDRPGPPGPQ